MKDLELLSESIHAYLLQQPGVDQKYLLTHCFRVVGTTTTFEENSVLVRYDIFTIILSYHSMIVWYYHIIIKVHHGYPISIQSLIAICIVKLLYSVVINPLQIMLSASVS